MNQELLFSVFCAILAVLLWYKRAQTRKAALAASLLFFLSLQLTGVYLLADSLSGAGIDESVIFHLKAGVAGAGFSDFYLQMGLASLYLLVTLAASVWVYKLTLNPAATPRRYIRVFAALLVFAGSFAVNPATRDLAFLYSQTRFESRVAPEGFLLAGPLRIGGQPKNFVILYLEQIERTYFDEKHFPGLMPHLKALEQEALSFSDIRQARGTSWSIAGMTAAFCGVPLVGAAATNSMSGMDSFLPGATCLGDLLKASGYRLDHLYGGDLDFAGWGTFFKTHGFDRVEGVAALELALPAGAERTPWGIHDEDLLALATRRFDELSQLGTPFGLTLNTLDTHHPSGHPGPYCKGITYGDGQNELLNTLHCADQMLAEFIETLRAKPAFENTVLLVASDHLAMPNTIWDQLSELEGRRNILMVFGADIEPQLVSKPGSSFDVGTTLLNQMGIPLAGIGLGRDLLSDTPSLINADPSLDDIILQNAGFMTSLWSYPQLNDGIIVDIENRELKLGDRTVSFPVLFTLHEDISVSEANFDFYYGYPLTEKAGNLWFDERFFWVDTCAKVKTIARLAPDAPGQYCAVAGMLGGKNLQVTQLAQADEIGFADLVAHFSTLQPDTGVYDTRLENIALYTVFGTLDVINYEPASEMVGAYGIWSMGGYGHGESRLRDMDSESEITFERGLTLLGLNSGAPATTLAYFDTCAYETPAEELAPLETDFLTLLAQNAAQYGAFVIVLHDSAMCSRYEIAPLFEGTGLERWREIGPRTPYIAVISGNGEMAEYVGEREAALVVGAANFIAVPE